MRALANFRSADSINLKYRWTPVRSSTNTPPASLPSLRLHATRKVGIVVVIIIVIIIAALAVFWGLGGLTPRVEVTAVDLKIGYTNLSGLSGYLGPSSQTLPGLTTNGGHRFTYTINFTSTSSVFSHSIDSIGVLTNGFTLISESPSLPQSISADGKVSITLTIQAPSSSFDAPLVIGVFTS